MSTDDKIRAEIARLEKIKINLQAQGSQDPFEQSDSATKKRNDLNDIINKIQNLQDQIKPDTGTVFTRTYYDQDQLDKIKMRVLTGLLAIVSLAAAATCFALAAGAFGTVGTGLTVLGLVLGASAAILGTSLASSAIKGTQPLSNNTITAINNKFTITPSKSSTLLSSNKGATLKQQGEISMGNTGNKHVENRSGQPRV